MSTKLHVSSKSVIRIPHRNKISLVIVNLLRQEVKHMYNSFVNELITCLFKLMKELLAFLQKKENYSFSIRQFYNEMKIIYCSASKLSSLVES